MVSEMVVQTTGMSEVVAHVRVDPDRCQGHNRCTALAPDLFQTDDLGYASAIGDGSVRADQLDAAGLAERNCPEYAVILEMMSS